MEEMKQKAFSFNDQKESFSPPTKEEHKQNPET